MRWSDPRSSIANAPATKVCASEVMALLAAEEASRNFLTDSALEITASQLAHQRIRSVAGKIIGHYHLDRVLGAGGMGEVYLAIDERSSRKVALKLLPDYFNGDPQRVRRFQQEARARPGAKSSAYRHHL